MSETPWLSEAEMRAWRGLQLMQMRLDRDLARQLAADSNLSHSDYLVLVVLTEHDEGRQRINDVGAILGWEKSRLSHHLTRMAKRGLVVKEACDADRRGSYIRISDEGRQAIESAAPQHVRTVRDLFIDQLTSAQLECLAEVAETILDRLDSGSASEEF